MMLYLELSIGFCIGNWIFSKSNSWVSFEEKEFVFVELFIDVILLKELLCLLVYCVRVGGFWEK